MSEKEDKRKTPKKNTIFFGEYEECNLYVAQIHVSKNNTTISIN